VLFAAVGIAAVAIAVALILVSVVGGGSSDNSPPAPSTAAKATSTSAGMKVPGAAETLKLLRGIPQRLNQLGSPKASATMIEFADLQCPFCREYTLNALPSIIDEYVRPQKVKLVFSGMRFIGPDSEKALRAVYAAGLQNRLWQFLDLLYKNQGAENSGWVTDDLLRSVGDSIPGFDTDKMIADSSSVEVTNALSVSDQQAQTARVNSTPTFFAGKTGGTLRHMNITALTPEAFRPTLDSLTK
jgi:protein-disulfide isomerase